MRIAFDLSSTHSDHQFRGIGFYTQNLWQAMQKIAKNDKDIVLTPYTPNSSNSFDLIHFPAFSPFFFSFPFNQIQRSIITVHDLIPIQYKQHYPAGLKGNLRWQTQRIALKFAKHIITDSDASRKTTQKLVGIKERKITTTLLAADSHFRRILNQSNLQDTVNKFQLPNKFILYVGDLNWNKQIMMLARICVKQRFPLYVVGKQATNTDIDIMHPWNEELVKFQNFAKEYPHIIKRLGYVENDDLVNLYNLATVLAFPSIEEGFGLPILEAMQSGCPVVCGDRSSMVEVAGDAAQTFDPTKPSSLRRVLRLVFNDSKLRLELSRKGLKRAEEFSWEKTAKKTIEVYKKYNI